MDLGRVVDYRLNTMSWQQNKKSTSEKRSISWSVFQCREGLWYDVEGSVSSPILFNIMMSDVFSKVQPEIRWSIYTDVGALWKRGRNVSHVERKIQEAIDEVGKWANCWGFRFSVAKTQVICFSRKDNDLKLNKKIYNQMSAQVPVVRYLGLWLDSKLTFDIHIKINNWQMQEG